MEFLFSLLVGVLFAVSVYLLLSKRIIRVLLGVVTLGNAVNLLIFTNGRLAHVAPPVIPVGFPLLQEEVANPLPQALILTAIVISFSFFAFLLVLGYRAFQELKSDDSDDMRVAEPVDDPVPPLGY